MTKRHAMWSMSAFLALGLGRPASAQTYTCLSDTTHTLYHFVVRLVTGTDSATVATRDALQLPAVAPSKVTVVTTATVCNKAGDAYHAAVTPAGTPPVSRTLVVVKVGSTRYVVLDPNELRGEFESNIVFDAKWNFLIGFTG
ncbi:MAG: hypothetical protein ACREA0_20210 [bacterium]